MKVKTLRSLRNRPFRKDQGKLRFRVNQFKWKAMCKYTTNNFN